MCVCVCVCILLFNNNNNNNCILKDLLTRVIHNLHKSLTHMPPDGQNTMMIHVVS